MPESYLPVSLNIDGRPCLVVGGGPVAARKARNLIDCGAQVTVIAPELSNEMSALEAVTHVRRPYQIGDAAAYRLVVTATGNPTVDGEVFADADAAGVWVNSADDPVHCSFILPSVHRDGSVSIAVSTAGRSPALASWLRRRVAGDVGDGLGDLAELLAEARRRLHQAGRTTETVDWAALLNGPLLSLVQARRMPEAQQLINQAIGLDDS
ncbi:MAG TPA: bifunctional precorrin-2 dehydrogenase/sirohydrochlorin ferrochelatase [Acidimicrobiales bacterium]